MDCECLPGCPFFHDKMENKPALANLMKKQYCQGDATDCARHRIFEVKGKDAVPSDLFPNQTERANQILGAG